MVRKTRGRGRLSAFDTLPPECGPLITQAAVDLSGREKTQTEIYREFVAGCEAIMAEHRGELEFDIPAFSSFNRYSIRQARLTRQHAETQNIVAAIATTFDVKKSDDLTIMLAETIKSSVMHVVADGEGALSSKELMELSSAFKAAVQAQSISTDRKRKIEAEFAAKVSDAVTMAAKVSGMSAETAEAIKAQILGVAA